MAQEKRYYWIKLKTDFFNQETMDFLLSQQNGCEYVVLYQMLCLNTANTNGLMISKAGEIIVPYDINKIVRDTKYFDYDTVAVALELFKKLGLIYEEQDKILKIANFENMIGSETSSAQRVREWRKNKLLQCNKNVTCSVIQDIRDKSIEYRNIKKELNKEKFFEKEQLNNAFLEWLEYKKERKETYKETGLKSLITQINKQVDIYGEEVIIELINECMANNYKGIIFDKLKNKSKKQEKPLPEWFGKEIKEEEISDEIKEFARRVREEN